MHIDSETFSSPRRRRPPTPVARAVASRAGRLVIASALAACVDSTPVGIDQEEARDPEIVVPPFEVLVSDPAFEADESTGEADSSATVVYVSLPSGTVQRGESLRITVRGHASTRFALSNGGLDPVPIDAAPGDTIELSVIDADSIIATGALVVAETKKPRVVRVEPPHGKRDVPLNARVIVVFSEPMDEALVVGGIELILEGVSVPADVDVSADGLVATVTPRELMEASSLHALRIPATLVDRDGDSLEDALETSFVTDSLLPFSLTVEGGDNQSGTIGATLAQPLQVSVRYQDALVEGIAVRWACVECGDRSGGPSLPPESLTNADGIASVPVTLGSSPGIWHVEASVDTTSVRFSVEVLAPPPPALVRVGGTDQADTVAGTLAEPLLVRVVRDGGIPVEGMAVRWVEAEGGANAIFIESGSATATTITGSDGVAGAHIVLGEQSGVILVQVSLPDFANATPVWFSAAARPGAAVLLVMDSATTFNNVGLVTITGTPLPAFHVFARDAHGNDVDAGLLDWSVDSGTAVVSPIPGSSAAVVTPLADGPLVVSVHAPGLAPLTFNAHGVAATVLTVGSSDGHCEEGDFIPGAVEIAAHRWVAWTICWNDSTGDGWSQVDDEWYWGYEHDVVFEDGTVTWPSTAGPPANWSPHFRTFDVPGSYRYRCTLHSTGFDPDDGETGIVIVH